MNEFSHQPVLLQEVLEHLVTKPNGIYVDATFGGGGHSAAILSRLGPDGMLLAIDKDARAQHIAEQQWQQESRFHFKQGSFKKLQAFCAELNVVGKVQGVLLDLGVSSPQLDDPQRGFSFLRDGPLDMRMDTTQTLTANTWVNAVDASTMVNVFREYGEERFAKKIVRAIMQARAEQPITTTKQLANIISQANPKHERDKHPATRCFLAIRLWINQELQELQMVLDQMMQVLAVGGRLVVISFHSLEDRIVKRFMKVKARGDDFPRDLPITHDLLNPSLRIIGKAIKPSLLETTHNPRSRSAIMRIAEKIK